MVSNDLKFTTAGDYMNQVTNDQKEELVEAIKGPHYYHISVSGYGAETAYVKIPKEAYDFWKSSLESGDTDLVHYVLSADEHTPAEVNKDDGYEEIDASTIPREAMFLHDEDDNVGCGWYEPPNEIEHVWAVSAESAHVSIEKVEGMDYGDAHIEDVIDHEDIYELYNRVGEETEWEVDLMGSSDNPYNYAEKGDYVFQFQSVEKGCFFDATFELPTHFDIKKLSFIIDEAPNGEDTVHDIFYDNEPLDNNGGDTNGKGYYAYVWEQEY